MGSRLLDLVATRAQIKRAVDDKAMPEDDFLNIDNIMWIDACAVVDDPDLGRALLKVCDTRLLGLADNCTRKAASE